MAQSQQQAQPQPRRLPLRHSPHGAAHKAPLHPSSSRPVLHTNHARHQRRSDRHRGHRYCDPVVPFTPKKTSKLISAVTNGFKHTPPPPQSQRHYYLHNNTLYQDRLSLVYSAYLRHLAVVVQVCTFFVAVVQGCPQWLCVMDGVGVLVVAVLVYGVEPYGVVVEDDDGTELQTGGGEKECYFAV
ncbi:hypothetical protein FN846DRAFT_958437 [Sphaerosporella brunnea]|uniref:Uncharacterized protein n=1 Tax=Sphaerosporella brunnea TaxID=1250544 RepID=A0A5J5ER20_9PEZI|nr:hypothetical protein FN846DRAFT_958437 [Sphaerosporella brunnea]